MRVVFPKQHTYILCKGMRLGFDSTWTIEVPFVQPATLTVPIFEELGEHCD